MDQIDQSSFLVISTTISPCYDEVYRNTSSKRSPARKQHGALAGKKVVPDVPGSQVFPLRYSPRRVSAHPSAGKWGKGIVEGYQGCLCRIDDGGISDIVTS